MPVPVQLAIEKPVGALGPVFPVGKSGINRCGVSEILFVKGFKVSLSFGVSEYMNDVIDSRRLKIAGNNLLGGCICSKDTFRTEELFREKNIIVQIA